MSHLIVVTDGSKRSLETLRVIAGMAGIAGSAVIRDDAAIGGHVGIRDHITVGAGAKVGAYSGIYHDVPDETSVLGVPANEAGVTMRQWNIIERLPAMRQEIRQLKKRLDALKQSEDH